MNLRSLFLPLKLNAEVRPATFNPGTWASIFIISSLIPSLKYSCSGSLLILAKGKTAIDSNGSGLLLELLEKSFLVKIAIEDEGFFKPQMISFMAFAILLT